MYGSQPHWSDAAWAPDPSSIMSDLSADYTSRSPAIWMNRSFLIIIHQWCAMMQTPRMESQPWLPPPELNLVSLILRWGPRSRVKCDLYLLLITMELIQNPDDQVTQQVAQLQHQSCDTEATLQRIWPTIVWRMGRWEGKGRPRSSRKQTSRDSPRMRQADYVG